MRIVVSCALVAVAFFVGWQTEKRDRAVMYLGYRRTAGLDKWNVTGQPIARFALETPRESAELFDIQVRRTPVVLVLYEYDDFLRPWL